jgi:TonB family protein
MKPFSALLILILFSNTCFSQTNNQITAASNKVFTDPHLENGSAVVKPDYTFHHTQLAVKQLTDHLRNNTEYPTTMVENTIEGIVVAKVWISSLGKIKQTEIVKSPHKVFDQIVLDTLKSFSEIDFQQSRYEGKQIVFVPLKFSLN